MAENTYNGDIILISRLSEFLVDDYFQWNEGEPIALTDITKAILKRHPEETEPFGDTWKNLCKEAKSTEWHIGRIIYFINHPEEIKDIEIDNLCSEGYLFPAPTIIDGNHRFAAALWLNSQGKMEKIHCRYGGRLDLLDYLTGSTDNCPDE